jgi:Trypsin-like peptidase domain
MVSAIHFYFTAMKTTNSIYPRLAALLMLAIVGQNFANQSPGSATSACKIPGNAGICGLVPFIGGEFKNDTASFTCKKFENATYHGKCQDGNLTGKVYINRLTGDGVREVHLAEFIDGRVQLPSIAYRNYFPVGHISYYGETYSHACLFLDGRQVNPSFNSRCAQLYANFGNSAVSKRGFSEAFSLFNLAPIEGGANPVPPLSEPKTATQPARTLQPVLKSSGTGFFVTKEYLITNQHVVRNCAKVTVSDRLASVVAVDDDADLALIRTAAQTVSPASIRSARPRLGEDAIAVGFPLSATLSGINVTRGNVSSLTGIAGRTNHLQFTSPIQPGNSGGPLLDDAGNVVGVVVSKLSWQHALKSSGQIPENVNFAITAAALKGFLDAHSIQFNLVLDRPKRLLPDISEEANSYTRILKCYASE